MWKSEINQIIFDGEGRAEIFSFRPEHIGKESKGNLFFVGNIGSILRSGDGNYYILNSIAAVLKKEYYTSSASQSSQAFEDALKKVNAFLVDISSEFKSNLELTVIVLWNESLMFSSFGPTQVLLIRNNRVFRLSKEGRNQFFRHVTKGTVREGDRIVVATAQINNFLTAHSFVARLLKQSWPRVSDYLCQKRIELKNKKTLAMLQISIQSASFQEQQTQEEEFAIQEPAQQASPLFHGPLRLRLPVLEEGPNYNSFFYTFLILISRAWKSLLFKVSLHHEPMRIPLRVRLPYQGLVTKGVTGIAIVLIGLFGGIYYITQSFWAVNPQEQIGAAQTQGALFRFSELSTSLHPQHALFTRQGIFLFAENQLYQINRVDQKVVPILSIPDDIKGLVDTGESIAIITKNASRGWEAVFYNAIRQSTTKEPLTWPLEGDIVGDVKAYAGNLYFLELLEKEILRYDSTDLRRPTMWLSSRAKQVIQSPLSFAIDGSIYLLDSSETILELRSGDIRRSIPLPAGKRADFVLTDAQMANIYGIDTQRGEVLIIGKQSGTLLSFVQNGALKEALAFGIDEAANLMEFLNPEGIFGIALPIEEGSE